MVLVNKNKEAMEGQNGNQTTHVVGVSEEIQKLLRVCQVWQHAAVEIQENIFQHIVRQLTSGQGRQQGSMVEVDKRNETGTAARTDISASS